MVPFPEVAASVSELCRQYYLRPLVDYELFSRTVAASGVTPRTWAPCPVGLTPRGRRQAMTAWSAKSPSWATRLGVREPPRERYFKASHSSTTRRSRLLRGSLTSGHEISRSTWPPHAQMICKRGFVTGHPEGGVYSWVGPKGEILEMGRQWELLGEGWPGPCRGQIYGGI